MESWARQAVAAGASPKAAAGAALIAGQWARAMGRYLGISPGEYWNKHLAGVVGPGSLDYAAGSMHVLGQAAMRRSEKPFEKFHEDALNEANSHQEFWDYGESPLLGLPVKVGEDRIRKSRSRHPDVTMEDWQRLPEIISGASEMHELPSKGKQWPVGSKAFICHEKGKSWVVIGAPRKKRGGYFEVLSLFSNNRDAVSNWLKQAGQNKKVLAGVGGGPNRAQAQDAKILGRTSPGGPSAKKITNLFASYKKKPNFDLDPAQAAKAVSRGKNISQKTLDKIAKLLQAKDQTLRALLDNPKQAGQILNALQKDGVIQKTNANVYWDSKTTPKIKDFGDPGRGRITRQGKLLVESSLLGAVLPDFGLLQVSPPWLLNVLGRNLDHLGRLKARGGAWDLSRDLLQAVDMVLAAEASPKAVDQLRQYIAQQALPGMEQEHSHGARAKALALALVENKPNAFREKLKALAKAAGRDAKGRESMFGTLSADDAFYQQFGRVESLGQPLNPGVDPDAPVEVVKAKPVYNVPGAKRPGLDTLSEIVKGKHKNSNTGWGISVSKRNVQHSMHSAMDSDIDTMIGMDAIANFPALIKNAVLVKTHPDKKNTEGVKQIHRFFVPFVLNGGVYSVKITVKEFIDGHRAEIDGIYGAYDLKFAKKIAPDGDYTQGSQGTHTTYPAPDASSITIRDLVAGVKDNDGDGYLEQSTNSTDTLFQSAHQGKPSHFSQNPIMNQAQKAGRRLAREMAAWKSQVRSALGKKLKSNVLLRVGSTPDVLQKLGAKNLPLIMTQGVLAKDMYNKHKIPQAIMEDLPRLIADPVAVFDSETKPGNFLVLTEAWCGAGPVVAAVHLDKKQRKHVVNKVVSMYSKDASPEKFFARQVHDGRLLYVNAGKAQQVQGGAGLQLPRRMLSPNLSNSKLLTEKNIVKPILPGSLPQGNRGAAHFLPDGRAVIQLFKSANPSTLVHELGHVFRRSLEELALTPDAPERVQKDWQAMAAFVGADPKGPWSIEQEETLARAFEAYVREGKAPAPGLRGVFETFRRWLVDLYKSVRVLDVELNDDIRGVFDRMLATDTEISRARAEAGVQPFLVGWAGGTPPVIRKGYLPTLPSLHWGLPC